MHLRPCRPKPNTRPTQGGTGADAYDGGNKKQNVYNTQRKRGSGCNHYLLPNPKIPRTYTILIEPG
jgi:hypothetical protein